MDLDLDLDLAGQEQLSSWERLQDQRDPKIVQDLA
jgi:hypothetical protein